MKRASIVFVLVICILTTIIVALPTPTGATVVASGTCGNNITWVLEDTEVLTISGTGSMTDYNPSYWVYAPWYSSKESIKKVIIDNGITNIGDGAFYECAALESITVGSNVISIGRQAFYDCTALSSILLPNAVEEIGYEAFRRCSSLKNVTIFPSLISIHESAFVFCNNLENVYYRGSTAQWQTITIGRYNDPFKKATIHIYDNSVITEPTCTKQGFTTHTCCTCDDSYIDSFVPPLGHNLVHHEAQASTCTKNGWQAYDTCSRCDYTTYINSPPLGHNLIQHDAKAPTCFENGWYAYETCLRCNYSTYCEIPAQHEIIHHAAQAPTCTQIGWDAYDTCSHCDYTTYAELPALGHDLVYHNAQEATCTAKGWEAYNTCRRCDYTTYKVIQILEHDLVHHDSKAATCTETGWLAYDTCSNCNYTTYVEIPALGHNDTIPVKKAATSEEAGYEGVKCLRCGEIQITRILPKQIANGICGNNLTWTLDEDGLLTIIGEGEIPNYSDSADIPWYNNRNSIHSLEICTGITCIGNNAFRGMNLLTSITIHSSLMRIGDNAFENCNSLGAVFFIGSKEQWNAISIGWNNSPLEIADLYLLQFGIVSANIIGSQVNVTIATTASANTRYVIALYNAEKKMVVARIVKPDAPEWTFSESFSADVEIVEIFALDNCFIPVCKSIVAPFTRQ